MAVSNIIKGTAAQQHGRAVKAAEYQTADEAERAAADAIDRGKLKDMQVVMRSSKIVAAQQVAVSGGGADVNVGAPRAVQEATEAVTEVDRRTVAHNAALEAYGLKSVARAHRQRGEFAAAEGEAAMWGTFLGGISQVIGTGGKIGADVQPTAGLDSRVET